MQRRGGVVRGFVIGLLAIGLLLGGVQTARAGEATVLGHVCIRDAKGLSAKIIALVNKFAPGMGDMMVAPQANEFFQKGGMAGVDWTKPISIALISGKAFGKTEPVPVVIMPVANAELLRTLTEKAGGPKVLDVRGNYAVASETEEAVKAITDQRLAIYSKFPKIAGNTDVYATFYIARALTEYMPEIEAQIKKMEGQMGGEGMPPGMAGPFAMMGKAMKVWGPMAKLASTQARRGSMMLQFNPDSLDIAGRLYAMEGSELETLLDGQPKATTDLVKFLPADCVMGASVNLSVEKMKPMVDLLMKTLAGPLEIKPEDQQKIMDLLFASTQTGASAAGLSGNAAHKGIVTAQIVQISDAAKFRDATKGSMEWLMGSGLLQGLQGMGMDVNIDYKAKAREYKGVPVDQITVTYKQAPGAQPNPMMPNRPPQVTEIAAVDTYGVSVSNNEAGDLLNSIIDRIKGNGAAGLDASAAYKAAVEAAKAHEGVSVVGYLSFNSFLAKMVEEIAKVQPMVAMMAGGIAKANPTEKPFTGYARFAKYRSGSAIDFQVDIPHQPILDLTQRVQMMMQQMKRPGPGMGPKPPAAKGDDDDF